MQTGEGYVIIFLKVTTNKHSHSAKRDPSPLPPQQKKVSKYSQAENFASSKVFYFVFFLNINNKQNSPLKKTEMTI